MVLPYAGGAVMRTPRTDEAATTHRPVPATVAAPDPARSAPPAELPAGATLLGGRFVVRRVLGRGGFGVTYATDDQRLQRRVAVKELFPDGAVRHDGVVLVPAHLRPAFDEARTRFLREARVLARFTHPGIVRVYEVFEANGTAYLVMELLEGRTLAAVLAERGGPLTEPEVLDVAARSAGALAQVHEAGVLHRDLNPSNLVLTDHGRVVLIDFGIARAFAGAEGTGTMTRVVTPGYAPPEQYLGQARFGPPTDVYGLAATLYRLLTDRAPTPAVDRQQGAPLTPPHRLTAAVSTATSAAVLDGLELNPDHRPQTLEQFTARLGLAGEPRASRSILVSGEFPLRQPAAVPPTDVESQRAATDATRADGIVAAATVRPPQGPAPAPPPAAAYRRVHPEAVLPPEEGGPASHRAGRWKLTLPVGVAVAALASAAPVVVLVLLIVAVLPALATAGDVLVARRRSALVGRGWYRGAALPAVVPVRAVRNLMWSLLRGLPALGLGVVLVSIAVALEQIEAPLAAREALLRAAGALTFLLVARPVTEPRRAFRAAAVTDVVADRVLSREGRLRRPGWWVWFAALAFTALGLWWTPELWPLPV
ncbi:hypothetical protein BH20ACT2_BH20ACT2_07850 [soil metagenome]